MPAVAALNLIPLRGVALRTKALNVFYGRGAAKVEGEFMIVMNELGLYAAVLACEMVARVNGALYVTWDIATRLLCFCLWHACHCGIAAIHGLATGASVAPAACAVGDGDGAGVGDGDGFGVAAGVGVGVTVGVGVAVGASAAANSSVSVCSGVGVAEGGTYGVGVADAGRMFCCKVAGVGEGIASAVGIADGGASLRRYSITPSAPMASMQTKLASPAIAHGTELFARGGIESE